MSSTTTKISKGLIVILAAAALLVAAGCSDTEIASENTALTCQDGEDNDLDGLIDCSDPECAVEKVCKNPCGGCDTPPADECSDGKTLTTYAPTGSCEGGQCVYQATAVGCEGGCSGGSCVEDPCGGVSCNEPPNVCFKPTGSCTEGGCSYDFDDGAGCDDGDACTAADACASGICAGQPISCDTPPSPKCKDATTLITYDAQGSCLGGGCDYPEKAISCSSGCDATTASCKGDPCAGVTCNQPPSACHKAAGVCSGGACTYLFDDGKGCDDGDPCTDGDNCQTGVCAGSPKVCNNPPAAKCKDTKTLTTWAAQGSCSGGSCSYAQKDVACPGGCDLQTNTCNGDPCAGVTCKTPPSPCHAPTGTCKNGSCTYPVATGKACDDGNPCTDGDVCTAAATCAGKTRTCASPPASTCKSGSVLAVYLSPGSCVSGSCKYTQKDVTCQFGCAGGACNGDPCSGVSCNSPPNSQCYAPQGVCSGGKCSYVTTTGACDDGNSCTVNDSCQSGTCAGSPMTCATPPASACKDASTLVVYNKQGSCVGGKCSYGSQLVACKYGCKSGACQSDPCASVSCTAPPKNYCKDTKTLVVYTSPGSCSGGKCSYASSDQVCTYGCDTVAGACKSDPCAGVSCKTPPKPVCATADTLRVYNSLGKCSGGKCYYSYSDKACEFGCQSGACLPDPCANVTCNAPPKPICVTNTTRRIYSFSGTCSGGKCSYPYKDQSCTYGCSNGACNPDPCANVSCTTPPKPKCLDTKTSRRWSSPGKCSSGKCIYPYSDTACKWGCNSLKGTCNPDPCANVSCTTPPKNYCLTSTSARRYNKLGKCSSGKCYYSYSDITCNKPPPPYCQDTKTLVVYSSQGYCTSGSCYYKKGTKTCKYGCAGDKCVTIINPIPL